MTAIITGASKGIGRGAAIALAGKGYNILVTGRFEDKLNSLAETVRGLGSECEYFICDHEGEAETIECFEELAKRKIDLVVNNAWGGYERMVEDGNYTWENKFWDQPIHRWNSMMNVGVRTAFLCSRSLVPRLLESKNAAIVNISFWAARAYMQNVIYGVSKAATDKLSSDMAHELREFKVPVISLYPGLVRTEAVLENARYFDMSNTESPEFVGLIIDGFMRDPKRMEKSGGFFATDELAEEYGILDLDGKKPLPTWRKKFDKASEKQGA